MTNVPVPAIAALKCDNIGERALLMFGKVFLDARVIIQQKRQFAPHFSLDRHLCLQVHVSDVNTKTGHT